MMNEQLDRLLDHCIKCSDCQGVCPVAAHNPQYPGPKLLGPDLARIKCAGGAKGNTPEAAGELLRSLEMCSGCQRCELACPYGVPVAQLIRQNRDVLQRKLLLRDKMLATPQVLGQMGTAIAPLMNPVLRNSLVQKMIKGMLGLEMEQPLAFASRKDLLQPTLRQWAGAAEGKVIYFPGCHVNYQEPEMGRAFLQLLDILGVKALVTEQICCGMPLLAAGNREEAHTAFQRNIQIFKEYVEQGCQIVTTCPSCSLTLKKIYVEELGTEEARQLASAVYDYSEYLEQYSSCLAALVHPLRERAVYHLPCHTQAQGTGLAGLQLMRLVPGLELNVVDDCCGQSGTYGFKAEKQGVSRAIGSSLVWRIASIEPDIIITPCGSCKDRLSFASGVQTVHPVQLLNNACQK
ncbi:MAG: anaerobic glycerol-3-phosphate dehydrogenase subunit C [Syntrophaceticus sp.]|nr:anaerobic glycerol-3-phosphate dehydrogenase subunit C [Syntrophaceticus sp.]